MSRPVSLEHVGSLVSPYGVVSHVPPRRPARGLGWFSPWRGYLGTGLPERTRSSGHPWGREQTGAGFDQDGTHSRRSPTRHTRPFATTPMVFAGRRAASQAPAGSHLVPSGSADHIRARDEWAQRWAGRCCGRRLRHSLGYLPGRARCPRPARTRFLIQAPTRRNRSGYHRAVVANLMRDCAEQLCALVDQLDQVPEVVSLDDHQSLDGTVGKADRS
jgi:hypothetical protein